MDIGQALMKKIRSQYGQLGQSGADAAEDLNKYSKGLETKESTGSGSSGAFVGPLSEDEYCDVCDKTKSECSCDDTKKVEATEATGASSSGQYSTPGWVAPNKKQWRGRAKTQIPGGKFVTIKKKCQKFPYCNQGDINALKLSENKLVKDSILNVSKKFGINEDIVKAILLHEMKESKTKRNK
jgi:hypothetical protein